PSRCGTGRWAADPTTRCRPSPGTGRPRVRASAGRWTPARSPPRPRRADRGTPSGRPAHRPYAQDTDARPDWISGSGAFSESSGPERQDLGEARLDGLGEFGCVGDRERVGVDPDAAGVAVREERDVR